MADNYLDFSEVIPALTVEEEAWLKSQLEQVRVIDGVEYAVDDVPEALQDKDPDWLGCRAYRDLEGYDADFGEEVGFEYSFSKDEDWGRHLWLYTEQWGYVERVAHLVQKFFKEFRPDQCWSLTWATTCSKLSVGQFGGGAVFVTASEIKWQITDDFVEEQTKAFRESRKEESDENASDS